MQNLSLKWLENSSSVYEVGNKGIQFFNPVDALDVGVLLTSEFNLSCNTTYFDILLSYSSIQLRFGNTR